MKSVKFEHKHNRLVLIESKRGYDKGINKDRQLNINKGVSLCDRKLYSADRGTLLYKVQIAKGVYGD